MLRATGDADWGYTRGRMGRAGARLTAPLVTVLLVLFLQEQEKYIK